MEFFQASKRVAAHVRSHQRGRFTTLEEHRPKSHQKYLEWTPGRIVEWARTIGPDCAKLLETLLNDRPHPEQGFRSCLGTAATGFFRIVPKLAARKAIFKVLRWTIAVLGAHPPLSRECRNPSNSIEVNDEMGQSQKRTTERRVFVFNR